MTAVDDSILRMPSIGSIAGFTLVLIALVLPNSAITQVTTQITFDNGFGPADATSFVGIPGSNGTDYQIQQGFGRTVDQNVFHSFDQFTIGTGDSADFTVGTNIRNVISRVIGGESIIDGRLSVNDGAGSTNFWMVNPAGIVFGANSVIDVGGTFNVGRVDYLKDEGEIKFSSIDESVTLEIANPSEFGFRESTGTGDVTLNGVNFGSALDETNQSYSGLNFTGRNITVTDSSIITLAGTDTAGDIKFSAEGNLSFSGSTTLVTGTDRIDTAGDISLNGDFIDLFGSKIIAGTVGSGDGGDLTIHGNQITINESNLVAGNTLEFRPDTPIQVAQDLPPNLGLTGNIAVEAIDKLTVDGGSISVFTFSDRDSDGEIHGRISLQGSDGSELSVSNVHLFSGTGGDSDVGRIDRNGTIPADEKFHRFLQGINGSSIYIDGDEVNLTNTNIVSGTIGSGDAGNIEVHGRNVTLMNNDLVVGTLGSGGDEDREDRFAETQVSGFQVPIGDAPWAAEFPNLPASEDLGLTGKIWIDAKDQITTNTDGTIETLGGTIDITGGRMLVFTYSDRPSNFFRVGQIDIGYTLDGESDRVHAFSTINLKNAELIAFTGGDGLWGPVNLQGQTVDLTKTDIWNATTGNAQGKGRNIVVSGESTSLTQSNLIAGTIGPGVGGNVELYGNRVTLTDSILVAGTSLTLTPAQDESGILILDENGSPLLDSDKVTLEYALDGNGEPVKVLGFAGNVTIGLPFDGVFGETAVVKPSNGGKFEVHVNRGSILTQSFSDRKNNGVEQGQIVIRGDEVYMEENNLTATTSGESSVSSSLLSDIASIFILGKNKVDLHEVSIAASTNSSGNAENIQIAANEVLIDNSEIVSGTMGIGNAGFIQVYGNTVSLTETDIVAGNTIEVSTDRPLTVYGEPIPSTSLGRPGSILIGKPEDFNFGVDDPGIIEDGEFVVNIVGGEILTPNYSALESVHKSDDIRIDGDEVRLSAVNVNALTGAAESAGNIFIRGGSFIILNHSTVEANTTDDATGDGGDILLDSINVTLRNGSELNVGTQGSGNGGNIDIENASSVTLDQSILSASTSSSGQGGNITVSGNEILLRDDSQLSTSTTSSGDGGDITIDARNRDNNGVLRLFITDIEALTDSDGNAGNISLFGNNIFVQDSGLKVTARDTKAGVIDLDVKPMPGIDQDSGPTIPLLLVDLQSLISAAAETGTPGEVNTNAVDVDLDSVFQEQIAEYQTGEIDESNCSPSDRKISLRVNDTGGTPPSPDRYLAAVAQTQATSTVGSSSDNFTLGDALLAMVQHSPDEGCR